MSLSEGEALLRAILEEPDEDAHRLVYADWLDEQGQPDRAGFIRLQCRLASFCEDGPFATAVPAEDLRPEHRRAWLAPLHALGLRGQREPASARIDAPPAFLFRRGFVEGIQLVSRRDLACFAKRLGAVFGLTPLRHLRVWRGAVNPFSAAPAGPPPLPTLLQKLADLPQAARLRSLDLRELGIGDPGASLLAASPHLSGRLRLRLEYNLVTAAVRRALGERFGANFSWEPSEDEIPF
jgi:uncharacterized protein (TIGR02996 family)